MKDLNRFGVGDVILLGDLLDEGYDEGEIGGLVAAGQLCRYGGFDDVFYRNVEVEVWGSMVVAKPLASFVVVRKFMGEDFSKGYWGEFSLLNKLGICDQVSLGVVVYSDGVLKEEQYFLDGTVYKIYPRVMCLGEYLLGLVFNQYSGWVDCSMSDLRKVLLKYIDVNGVRGYYNKITNSDGLVLFKEVFSGVVA